MAATQVQVLGPFAVRLDGEPVELSSRKQRALLAVLALSPGQVLSVDRLVDDLWGERPPVTARHALQVHVSQLRKLLGATVVGTERPGYVLRVPAAACDVHQFELLVAQGRRALRGGRAQEAAVALASALELWRGPALSDLLAEPFAAQEAARLEELRLAATEERLAADLELGRHAELIAELESLVARHPLRERLWGLLMLASYRAGRQVEALRTYTTLRERLRDDLGLDPGPELQDLEAAILRQDPALAAPVLVAEPEPIAVPAAAPSPLPTGSLMPSVQESRRVATVVAAALVGFDQVSRTLDPEDLSALLDGCMAQLGEVVLRYGGSVEHAAGGELTAVFGAPVAHEDDPERAVRAGVDLRRAVTAQPSAFAGLDLRVGISTGEVLFAASGPPGRRQLTAVGDVVHEARRLQAQAGAAVVVGLATSATTGGAVQYRELGAGAFEVVDVAPVQQPRRLVLTPFVGRDAEAGALLGVWQRTVSARRPHLVSVLGEPGVGKSRQLAELRQLIGAEGRVLTGRCLPYGEALSYAPLAEVLRQAAGATADEPLEAARARLDALVRSLDRLGLDAADVVRHLALLTGLDDEVDRAAGLVDERTLHLSARRFLEALARQGPLCVVLDDVHWADDALLELVQAFARRIRDVPLLLVTLARPELVERRPDWGGGLASFVSIPLQPLDHDAISDLVSQLGRAHGLPEDVLAELARKSGGNPLFAEELVATLAEGDPAAGVPASLASLLLARLDALPAEQQRVLRCASVLGMTFWTGGIAALDGSSAEAGSALQDALADLGERDLLRQEDASALVGQSAYSFKHVLLRDAAYASLPRRQRKELHAAAASWLTAAAGERVSDFADQLAHHAVAAGQPELALEHLMTAADRSRRAAAHRREAALLAEAAQLAVSLERPALVAELHAQRGRALSRIALWGEARTELEAALEGLPDSTPDQLRRRAEVHCDLSAACFWLLDTDAIRAHAEAALELGLRIGSYDVQLAARAQITSADSATGDVERVLTEGRSLEADADAWGVPLPYERLGGYSLQLYLTGDGESAIEVSRAAVRTGRAAGDTQGVLWNMPHIGMAAAAAGRYDEALTVFREARHFGEEYELLAGLPRCIAMSAGFHLDLFDFAGAEEIQEEARDLGRSYFHPSAVSAGIDLLFNFTRRGDLGAAERLVDSVGEEVMAGGGWHGWLWRLRFTQLQAELAAARGEHEAALQLARDALAQSRSKKRTKYEVYARITLGGQLAATGRKRQGLEELSTATALAQQLGNPALHVLAAGALLASEPHDGVASASRSSVDRVLASLSDPTMRTRFLCAEPVGAIISFGGAP